MQLHVKNAIYAFFMPYHLHVDSGLGSTNVASFRSCIVVTYWFLNYDIRARNQCTLRVPHFAEFNRILFRPRSTTTTSDTKWTRRDNNSTKPCERLRVILSFFLFRWPHRHREMKTCKWLHGFFCPLCVCCKQCCEASTLDAWRVKSVEPTGYKTGRTLPVAIQLKPYLLRKREWAKLNAQFAR